MAAAHSDKRLVVTGYSLGAGLAGHVAKHPETAGLIKEAWLFNPSPKQYAHDAEVPHMWMAAMRGEALSLIRAGMFRLYPGVHKLGVPSSQKADDYYLVKSTSIYAHYRWTLTRNILFAADFAHEFHPGNGIGALDENYKKEPIEILAASRFKCESKRAVSSLQIPG